VTHDIRPSDLTYIVSMLTSTPKVYSSKLSYGHTDTQMIALPESINWLAKQNRATPLDTFNALFQISHQFSKLVEQVRTYSRSSVRDMQTWVTRRLQT